VIADEGRLLEGFTVGITAGRRAEEQAALFSRRGASVVHGPAIQILPLGAEEPLRQATAAVLARPPAAFVANTGIGVRSWFAAAEAWGQGPALVKALSGARIYARGPKAAGAVHAAGLHVVGRAPSERLGEAVEMTLEHLVPGDRVVVQVDGSGRPPADLERLERAGAQVVVAPVYRWKLPDDGRPARRLAEAVIAGRVHAVTFTAAPAVRNWMQMAADDGIDADLRRALTDGRVVVGCVGPVCTDAAVAEGLLSEHLVEPELARLGPLVRAVGERLAARRIAVDVGDTEIVLAGTSVTVAGSNLRLTDTEARLLGALAAQPNVVFTKQHLLNTVWGKGHGDVHAVEMGVARLRRRLGPYGEAIRSVHRRGYTLRT
jgi:uroporphyrinogen-III synthase